MNAPHAAVVVGIDGSADSDRALDWAVRAAARRNAPLHLMYALSQERTDVPLAGAEVDEDRAHGTRVLDEARTASESTGIAVTSGIVEAPAAEALIEASEEAALIVVGSRGLGALSGLLLGSVGQHVARHATCPVVVVREQANTKATRIVVGVDAGPSSDKAIGFAVDEAARLGAPLTAILSSRATSEWLSPEVANSRAVARAEEGKRLLSEALAGWSAKYPEVQVTPESIPVHPARALADASEAAALVVVGSRGRGAFAGLLLGSVSQHVLNHARCPIAVVR